MGVFQTAGSGGSGAADADHPVSVGLDPSREEGGAVLAASSAAVSTVLHPDAPSSDDNDDAASKQQQESSKSQQEYENRRGLLLLRAELTPRRASAVMTGREWEVHSFSLSLSPFFLHVYPQ